MAQFDDRERGEEAKYALDDEQRFRATARRNRLLGTWAAAQLGLTGDAVAAYAAQVVEADFAEAGDEDVIRKVSGDLKANGAAVTDETIRQKLAEFDAEARRQIASGS